MAVSLFRNLRERAEAPVTDRWLEVLVGLALASWTLGNLVMSHAEIAGHPFFSAHSWLQFSQAFTFGCLIAVVASRGFELNVASTVLLGLLLFVALAVRGRSGDYHPIVLILLIIASQGMDFSRLAYYWLCAVLAAVGLTLLFMDRSSVLNRFFMLGKGLVGSYGFSDPHAIPALLVGVTATMVLVFKDERLRVPLMVFCAIGAVSCRLVFLSGFEALLLLALGFVVFADWKGIGREFLSEQARTVRWVVALLPIALAVAVYDLVAFYNLASVGGSGGGYAMAVKSYGLGYVVCFALLYLRAVFVMPLNRNTLRIWEVFLVLSLYIAASRLPAYIEFNPTLLLLSAGLGSMAVGETLWGGGPGGPSSPDLDPCAAPDVAPHGAADDAAKSNLKAGDAR